MKSTARSLAVSALATAALSLVLRWAPSRSTAPLLRTNHRGEAISLRSGPALVLGTALGVVSSRLPIPQRLALGFAGITAGVFGAYDDFAEGDHVQKGLRGHLMALTRGEVTTGAIKIVGLAASGVLAAAFLPRPGRAASGRRDSQGSGNLTAPPGLPTATVSKITLGQVPDAFLGGAVIAGSANLINLLDLRPGRALKVVLLAAPLVLTARESNSASFDPRSRAASIAAASAMGAAAALLPEDLAERTMLGDTGANSAGALLGAGLVSVLGRRGRVLALLGLTALTVASERVSFTKVIEATPGLREFDRLGRRPR